MGASRCFTHLELSQPTGIFLIPLPLYLNAQECSPTYMASARHYFYLKFRSIFAHQKHMLRLVKCTQSAHNEEHLGAHNLSSLLNCPELCEYVYRCYRHTGNTVLLSRFLIYMSMHDLSYGGPCCEETFRPEPKRLRAGRVSFKLTHSTSIYSELQTLLCDDEVDPLCWNDDVWNPCTS